MNPKGERYLDRRELSNGVRSIKLQGEVYQKLISSCIEYNRVNTKQSNRSILYKKEKSNDHILYSIIDTHSLLYGMVLQKKPLSHFV